MHISFKIIKVPQKTNLNKDVEHIVHNSILTHDL
jgi:hypothetical protein